MSIYVKSFLTCEKVTFSDDDKASFYNIFHNVKCDELPLSLDGTKLVCILEIRSSQETEVLVEVKDPDGETLPIRHPINIQATDHFYIFSYVMNLNFQLRKEGFYTFFLVSNHEIIGFHDLLVTKEG